MLGFLDLRFMCSEQRCAAGGGGGRGGEGGGEEKEEEEEEEEDCDFSEITQKSDTHTQNAHFYVAKEHLS